jgi:MoaA/NifB/PqqE/SkfB family radical SAM enzyme
MTGYGDPFASVVFRDFLRNVSREKFPSLKIAIMTNGLLLTPKMWESMPGAHRVIDSVHVSIDGCSKETYALNRGGDFSLLLNNLSFIASIRQSLTIHHFEISFVVQQNNFREMPDFVRLGERLNCDKILFQRLVNWGTYTTEDYRTREIHDEAHPDHHEFRTLLSSDIFKSPAVDLANLSNFRDTGT